MRKKSMSYSTNIRCILRKEKTDLESLEGEEPDRGLFSMSRRTQAKLTSPIGPRDTEGLSRLEISEVEIEVERYKVRQSRARKIK